MKRKLIGILLIALMLLAFALHSIAFAETSYQVVNDQQDKALFMTPSTPQRIVDFAFRILPEIAYPIGEEGIFSLSELPYLALGSPINYYDLKDSTLLETNKYIFPVLLNGNIRASLEILDATEGLSASLHASGITQGLSSLIQSKHADRFLLIVGDSLVFAANQNELILLFDAKMDESSDRATVQSDVQQAISSFASVVRTTPIQQSNQNESYIPSIELVDPTQPIGTVQITPSNNALAAAYPSSAAISMTPVPQTGEDCGAASIAAIVNKIKGTSLTSAVVNQAASGSSQTATTTQLVLYINRTYSLFPTMVVGGPSLTRVQEQIVDRSRPLWSVFSTPTKTGAHAMALNGYAQQPGAVYYQWVTTWQGYSPYVVVMANSTFVYGGHTLFPNQYGYGF